MGPVKSIRRHGKIRVAAHALDGGLIDDPALMVDVQMKRGGGWATVGTASVSKSTATVKFAIPKRVRAKRVILRARDRGAG